MVAVGRIVKGSLGVLCLYLVVACLFDTRVAWTDPVPPPARLPVCGDQDESETPFVLSCADLSRLPDVQTFTVSGSGGVRITFDFVYRQASLNNELGFFLVDEPDGSMDGLHPGDGGYLQAAYRRAQIIFHSGSDSTTADVVRLVPGGSILLFFLVSNATLADLETANPENRTDKLPVVFFSWDALNPDGLDHFVGYQDKTGGHVQFGFEDLLTGGDIDYDDVVYNVSAIETGAVIAPTTSSDGGRDVLPIAAVGMALAALVVVGGGYWFWRHRSVLASEVSLPARPPVSEPVPSGGRAMPVPVKVNAWVEVGSDGAGHRYPLADEPITIGFTSDCSINLARVETDRWERVRIWRREGAYMLHNLSRLGIVSVGGRPAATWTVLEDGDEIVLGNRRLIFHAVSPPGDD